MNEPVVDTVKKPKTKNIAKEPPYYRLIFMNDDITTFEFVVETLVQMFDYAYEDAAELAKQINEHGSGTVVVLPYELAEQKGIEVTLLARSHGFPLQVRIEPAI